MKSKLLFFDIDGTLLCGSLPGYIPASATEALKKAQAKGHYVFINTGRAWSYLPQAVKDYPFDGYICGCGTYVRLHDRVLYRHEVPEKIRKSLPGLFRKCGVQGLFEGTDHLYIDREIDPFPPIEMICRAYTTYTGKTAGGFCDPDPRFEKFIIIGNDKSDADLFREETGPYFSSFAPSSLGDWFFEEYVPSTCSKATGIDIVADSLNLTTDDCFVFGDGPNDISMMKHVKYSIAMGNSREPALAAASYVTTPARRDGIRNAMLYYGLID